MALDEGLENQLAQTKLNFDAVLGLYSLSLEKVSYLIVYVNKETVVSEAAIKGLEDIKVPLAIVRVENLPKGAEVEFEVGYEKGRFFKFTQSPMAAAMDCSEESSLLVFQPVDGSE